MAEYKNSAYLVASADWFLLRWSPGLVNCAVDLAPEAPTSWILHACACKHHEGVAVKLKKMPALTNRPVGSPLRCCCRMPRHLVLQLSGHRWRLPLEEDWWAAASPWFSEIFSPWCDASIQEEVEGIREEEELGLEVLNWNMVLCRFIVREGYGSPTTFPMEVQEI